MNCVYQIVTPWTGTVFPQQAPWERVCLVKCHPAEQEEEGDGVEGGQAMLLVAPSNSATTL